MAWDQIPGGGYSGDEPIDALASTLERIARAYVQRFGRRPTRHELQHAFSLVLEADPDRYVEDPESGSAIEEALQLDVLPEDYEARVSEVPGAEGDHIIARKDDGAEVLRCAFDKRDRVLACRYRIYGAGIGDATARSLITATILHHLTNNYYADLVDTVRFSRRDGGQIFEMRYPK